MSVNSMVDDGLLIVQGVTVLRVPKCVEISSGSLIFRDSKAENGWMAIDTIRGPVNITNCEFYDFRGRALSTNSGAHNVIVRDCYFYSCNLGFGCGSTPGFSIRDCNFVNCGDTGVLWGSSTSGEIGNCLAEGNIYTGISLDGVGEFHVFNNMINSVFVNLLVSACNNILIENNVLWGSSLQCVDIMTCTPVFQNNHILKNEGLLVYVGGYVEEPNIYIDMTNNYWGTDSPDSISSWIRDGYDDTTFPVHGFVNFTPFSDVPLPNEKTTMDSFKALFRPLEKK
ncbi:MAG: right-handed parallel beta-helix repeat-containing protein [bacterium]|nr:right-handed parallel beta-helix repeat-containing protein [bacterium]